MRADKLVYDRALELVSKALACMPGCAKACCSYILSVYRAVPRRSCQRASRRESDRLRDGVRDSIVDVVRHLGRRDGRAVWLAHGRRGPRDRQQVCLVHQCSPASSSEETRACHSPHCYRVSCCVSHLSTNPLLFQFSLLVVPILLHCPLLDLVTLVSTVRLSYCPIVRFYSL